MQITVNALFALQLALLFTHEMDAVYRKEWKMFIVLKDMNDEKACRIFMLAHIPLYALLILLLLSSFSKIGFYIADIFLIAHLFLHLGFRKNPANKMNNTLSKCIIISAGLLAFIHLILFTILY